LAEHGTKRKQLTTVEGRREDGGVLRGKKRRNIALHFEPDDVTNKNGFLPK